jgi:hypothetical protein
VESFDPQEAKSIKECQDLFTTCSLKADLTFIKANLSFLPKAICQLEEAGLPLTNAVNIVKEVKTKIECIPGQKGQIFKDKLSSVLQKNAGFQTLIEVSNALAGEDFNLPSKWDPSDIADLKYCPVASVDVERSFSMFKHIFSDRRHSFTEENLTKTVIVNSYHARKQ